MKPIELWHGDCLELMAKIPDGSVDMVFADLPYAHVSKAGKLKSCTSNSWDVPVDLSGIWKQILRVARQDCPIVFTATQPFSTHLINSMPSLFRYELIWQKNISSGFLLAKKRPMAIHESVLVFYRRQPYYCPQMMARADERRGRSTGKARLSSSYDFVHRDKPYTYSDKVYPVSIIKHALTPRSKSLHSAQKPVTMLEWLLKSYTRPGDTVLDPTMGSGTTCVAAHNLGRRAIGIEKDDEYFRVAVKRVKEAMAQPKQGDLL